jgi:hypothetical protein
MQGIGAVKFGVLCFQRAPESDEAAMDIAGAVRYQLIS